MNQCPSREQLQQLLEERLSEALLEAVEKHVDGCQACQQILARLSDDSGEVDAPFLHAACAESPPEPMPEWVRQLEENPPGPARPASGTAEQDEETAIEFPGPPTEQGPLGRLGSFHIRKQLGVGRFGVVYQAYDELERLVALKVLKPELAACARERNRFEEEAHKV